MRLSINDILNLIRNTTLTADTHNTYAREIIRDIILYNIYYTFNIKLFNGSEICSYEPCMQRSLKL